MIPIVRNGSARDRVAHRPDRASRASRAGPPRSRIEGSARRRARRGNRETEPHRDSRAHLDLTAHFLITRMIALDEPEACIQRPNKPRRRSWRGSSIALAMALRAARISSSASFAFCSTKDRSRATSVGQWGLETDDRQTTRYADCSSERNELVRAPRSSARRSL